MANIVPNDVKERFPEFNSVADAHIEVLIEDTLCNFDQDRWDCLYTRGHSLYVAHILATYGDGTGADTGDDAGGPVNAEAADGVSRSYSTFSPTDMSEGYLSRTKYGQEFAYLQRSVGLGGSAVCIT